MIVLGIDPGTALTGYGVVRGEPLGALELVECGVIRTSARDALRIVDALVPLARAGELDAKLVRVLRYRRLLRSP